MKEPFKSFPNKIYLVTEGKAKAMAREDQRIKSHQIF
jgi:hypothetical protein